MIARDRRERVASADASQFPRQDEERRDKREIICGSHRMNQPTPTLGSLESYLWEAANILRGPVDAADFKTYVFPLLFFKRISDVHDDEHAAALVEFGGDEDAALFRENYRFQVPEDCHWRDVRVVAKNVGQALQTSLRGIEQANPHTLYGIFGDAQWTNKDRLSDALLRWSW